MDAMMARILSGVKSAESVTYEKVDGIILLRLRMEVDTMLPHELSVLRTFDMTITEPKDGRVTIKQVDRRVSRYSYDVK